MESSPIQSNGQAELRGIVIIRDQKILNKWFALLGTVVNEAHRLIHREKIIAFWVKMITLLLRETIALWFQMETVLIN